MASIAPGAAGFRGLRDGGSWLALDGSAADVAGRLGALGLPAEVKELLTASPPSVFRKQTGAGTFLGLARHAIGSESGQDRTLGCALWIEPDRLVSVDSGATRNLRAAFDGGAAAVPETGLWALVAAHLAEVSEALEDDLQALAPSLDVLEDRIAEQDGSVPVDELSALRQRLIRVRRHAVPFALLTRGLASDRRIAADPEAEARIRDIADSAERSQAALGLHFERSEILHDQIQSQLAERMNRATYRLGVVATVFLPLGFLTGLLGINVAGIPGDHDPYAFWLVCGFLLLVAVAWTAVIARSGKL